MRKHKDTVLEQNWTHTRLNWSKIVYQKLDGRKNDNIESKSSKCQIKQKNKLKQKQ